MCGICGLYNLNGEAADSALVSNMISMLRHRGPDDQGFHADGPIALGHTRLAIIDQSLAAHQPMTNENGKRWIVYNGEVYNHRELRHQLEIKGYNYRSNVDTESVLHAYEEYGEECLQHLRGMYAFAIWDISQHTLFLAVDRLGIKPLYYTRIGDTFLFASEIKALLLHPSVRREIDFVSLDEYLRYCYVPAPRTIFKGIERLLPGHYINVQGGKVQNKCYWNLCFKSDGKRSEHDWIEETREQLRKSVQDELESVVPLGALLSGGIDSSAIVAFMSEVNRRKIQTFTIGFNTEGQNYNHYDEKAYAHIIAQRFGTEHHEIAVEPRVLDVLPKIIWAFDEPFANVTAIPTWYLCQITRQHVTVILSGTGGDESFGGYPRYLGARLLMAYFTLPKIIRESFLKRLALILPQRPDSYFIFNRVKKFILGVKDNPLETYCHWMSFISDEARFSLYTPLVRQELSHNFNSTTVLSRMNEMDDTELLNRIFYADLMTYLPDNLLTYCDRMASAHSLEMRVPFCDHRLIEFAARIPPNLKLKGFNLKYLMKKAMNGLLPNEILYRRKQGFSVPLGCWLQGELLPLAKALLSPKIIEQRGYFNASTIQKILNQHVAGKADHSAQLWALLIFEIWHTLYIDNCSINKPNFSLRESCVKV